MDNKLYVMVRRDLAATLKMVQGAHALVKLVLESPEVCEDWNNHTLIFLDVPTYKDMLELAAKLRTHLKGEMAKWYEEALDGQLTAIAFYPDALDEPFLSTLPLDSYQLASL